MWVGGGLMGFSVWLLPKKVNLWTHEEVLIALLGFGVGLGIYLLGYRHGERQKRPQKRQK